MGSVTVPFSVSQMEFVLFHKIDRELYKFLVMNLFREPVESIHVLAMWLWLEKVGFRNVVHKIKSLPFILINEVADETITCLNCINNSIPPAEGNDNILTLQSLVESEISLKLLFENRDNASQGVAKMVQGVCLRAVGDLMQEAIMMRNNINASQRNLVPGNQLWYGSFGPAPAGPVRQNNEVVPADDRTLFVTFSKGYRVGEWEVMEYFTKAYGDCIETLYMQEVPLGEQPLFARIVFYEKRIIELVLQGEIKAKFSINGKHVWARKFVPKRTARNFLGESSNSSRSGSARNFLGESSNSSRSGSGSANH